MSVSCSDCFSDLLCSEDSTVIFSNSEECSPECSFDLDFQPPQVEESITDLLEDERDFIDSIRSSRCVDDIDPSARANSVAWILKVQRYHGFRPLTAYFAFNYFDRFLYRHPLPKMNGWQLQLLSVACVSIAAKMEEPLVPSLLDLQVEGAKYIFEPKNIQRMELLVLRVLDWRLRCITPFSFVNFFAHKVDPTGTYTGFFTSRATQIILSNIQEISFVDHRPSCIAAATILCAANELPSFSFITAQHTESWCNGLDQDNIISCQQLVRKIASDYHRPRKQPKVLPQLRIMARPLLSSSESSSSSSSSYKRRRLNDT